MTNFEMLANGYANIEALKKSKHGMPERVKIAIDEEIAELTAKLEGIEKICANDEIRFISSLTKLQRAFIMERGTVPLHGTLIDKDSEGKPLEKVEERISILKSIKSNANAKSDDKRSGNGDLSNKSGKAGSITLIDGQILEAKKGSVLVEMAAEYGLTHNNTSSFDAWKVISNWKRDNKIAGFQREGKLPNEK